MAQLPCPRCGSKDTVGTFCRTCLRELYPLVKAVKPIALTFCANCPHVLYQGAWVSDGFEKVAKRAIKNALVIAESTHVEGTEIVLPEIERKPGIQREAILQVTITGRHEDVPEPYDEEYEISARYAVTLCQRCRKLGTAYYEGILQIRNESEQAKEMIIRYLVEHAPKGLHLAKRMEIGSGTDYFLSSNRAVGHLARKLHKEFGGELKVNAQHFSQDRHSGKILYRTNALLELPEYRKGDVIKRDGTHWLVLGIAATVRAERLPGGGEEHFPYRHGDAERLPVLQARVVRARPPEILHPLTFAATTPVLSKYAPAELDAGSEVTVAVDGDLVFLIPPGEDRTVEKRQKRRVSQKRASSDRHTKPL